MYDRFVHFDDSEEIRMAGLDTFGNGIHDFLIGDRIIIWDHDIEDDIGMGGTFDNAKIMHAKLRIDLIQVSGDLSLIHI